MHEDPKVNSKPNGRSGMEASIECVSWRGSHKVRLKMQSFLENVTSWRRNPHAHLRLFHAGCLYEGFSLKDLFGHLLSTTVRHFFEKEKQPTNSPNVTNGSCVVFSLSSVDHYNS